MRTITAAPQLAARSLASAAQPPVWPWRAVALTGAAARRSSSSLPDLEARPRCSSTPPTPADFLPSSIVQGRTPEFDILTAGSLGEEVVPSAVGHASLSLGRSQLPALVPVAVIADETRSIRGSAATGGASHRSRSLPEALTGRLESRFENRLMLRHRRAVVWPSCFISGATFGHLWWSNPFIGDIVPWAAQLSGGRDRPVQV